MTAPLQVRESQRLQPLDAARGLAMLGVCLSHFGIGVGRAEPGIAALLWRVGMIASPTFIFLSGAVLGYLVVLRQANPIPLRIQLIDRALFLLTIAHVAIDGAHYQRFKQFSDVTHALFMTDTIAVSLVLGVVIVPFTNRIQRLAIAAVAYVCGWLVVLFWHPVGHAALLLKETLFGSTNQYTDVRQNFPIVPWFAIYLAATVLGEAVWRARQSGSLVPIGRKLVSTGPRWIVAALAVKAIYLLARPALWTDYASMPPLWRDLYDLTTPYDKYPPGPTYLLAYGGLALMLIGGVIIVAERGWARGVLEAAAATGRASLIVFVVQFYLYYLVVPRLPLNHRWLLLPYFLLSVFLLWLLAQGWNRIGGNRFFTVGVTAWSQRRAAPRSAMTAA